MLLSLTSYVQLFTNGHRSNAGQTEADPIVTNR